MQNVRLFDFVQSIVKIGWTLGLIINLGSSVKQSRVDTLPPLETAGGLPTLPPNLEILQTFEVLRRDAFARCRASVGGFRLCPRPFSGLCSRKRLGDCPPYLQTMAILLSLGELYPPSRHLFCIQTYSKQFIVACLCRWTGCSVLRSSCSMNCRPRLNWKRASANTSDLVSSTFYLGRCLNHFYVIRSALASSIFRRHRKTRYVSPGKNS